MNTRPTLHAVEFRIDAREPYRVDMNAKGLLVLAQWCPATSTYDTVAEPNDHIEACRIGAHLFRSQAPTMSASMGAM